MKFIHKYLLKGSPVVLLPLGAGFVMASSKDVRAALGMGAAVLVAMLLSSIVICAIKKFIPDKFHLPIYILIVTGFVSLIDMFMSAHFGNITEMLGVHLAALAVSAVPYREAEEFSALHNEKETIISALLTGVFFTLVMVICALFREVLGNASFAGIEIGFLANYKVSALAGAFGGYLLLAILTAVINKVTQKLEKEEN